MTSTLTRGERKPLWVYSLASLGASLIWYPPWAVASKQVAEMISFSSSSSHLKKVVGSAEKNFDPRNPRHLYRGYTTMIPIVCSIPLMVSFKEMAQREWEWSFAPSTIVPALGFSIPRAFAETIIQQKQLAPDSRMSTVEVLRNLHRSEGSRGASIKFARSVCSTTAHTSMVLSSLGPIYNYFQRINWGGEKINPLMSTLITDAISATLSGTVCTIAMTPVRLSTVLQSAPKTRGYGFVECWKEVWKQHGISMFKVGTKTTILQRSLEIFVFNNLLKLY